MNLKRGDRVKIVTGRGSCLNGVAGTIEGATTMFGASAWKVNFDLPVVYPSGNTVVQDIVFGYEIERVRKNGTSKLGVREEFH